MTYTVNKRMLFISGLIEATVISTSLFAAWAFAEKYAGSTARSSEVAALAWPLPILTGHSLDWELAIAGGILLAAAELARLPLVHGFRTHASWIMRIVALVGVILCIGITTKSVTVVMQMAYAPRLHQVQHALADLKVSEADLVTLQAHRGTSDNALSPLQKRVDDANARMSELNANIQTQGQAPKPRAVTKTIKGVCWDRKHAKSWSCPRTSTIYVNVPWAGQQFADQLEAATAERDAAVVARDTAAGTVGQEAEQIAAQEREITGLRNGYREAVMNSQVHGLAAILYGVDPIDITEQQAHAFLRLFVLVPGLFIACASTLLAMTAYQRIKPPKQPKAPKPPRTVALDSPKLSGFITELVDARIKADKEISA